MMLLRPAPQRGHVAMATAELAATQRRPVRFGLRLCLRSQKEAGITSAVTRGRGVCRGGHHHHHHHGEHDFFLLETHRLFFVV